MNVVPAQTSNTARRSLGRSGFSFTEILFAVMVLGIGFIMVAAIFPVAIKQTQATGEETVASTMAKGAVSYLARNASTVTMPVDPAGKCIAIGPDTTPLLWAQVGENVINPIDPRCAWVAAFVHGNQSNGSPSTFAQVIVVSCQIRNASNYTVANDLKGQGTPSPGRANLEFRPFSATFTYGSSGAPDQVSLTTGDPNDANEMQAPVENAYMIMSNDTSASGTTQPSTTSNANGWVYRLGTLLSDNGTTKVFQLAPGNDTAGATYRPAANQAHTVLILGAGPTDPTTLSSGYSGLAQDVAVYTTFVIVH